MNDLRLRDQCAFISISRSMIASPRESILRRLYWKMDRKTTRCHSLPAGQSNDQRVMMWRISAGDIKAARQCAALCVGAVVLYFTSLLELFL